MNIQLSGFLAFLLVLIAILITAGVIVFLVLYLSKKYNRINLFNKIKLSDEDKNKAKEQFACYNSLCHPEKLSYIIMRILNFSMNISELQRSILRDQEKYIEQKLEYLKNLHVNIFIRLLKEKEELSETLVTKSDNFQILLNILDRVYDNLEKIFRTFMLENHFENFENLPTEKWKIYKADRIELILQKIRTNFSIYFVSQLLISKKDIDENDKKYFEPLLLEVVEDIFERCLKINKEKRIAIEQATKDIEDFSKKISGEYINFSTLK